MDVIWKFPLAAADLQSIEMPVDAQVLTVQVQVGPCLWAQCDPEAPKAKRFFETFGTGHPISPGSRKYVGTYQLHDGGLVFHVFERLTRDGGQETISGSYGGTETPDTKLHIRKDDDFS